MPRGFGKYDRDGPSLDGSVLVGFILVVMASFGAFVWVNDVQDRYTGDPVRVYQPEAEDGEEGSAADEVDEVTTASVVSTEAAASETPQCDVNACTKAYRSFRVSDCTFQPYNGPRKLCTR